MYWELQTYSRYWSGNSPWARYATKITQKKYRREYFDHQAYFPCSGTSPQQRGVVISAVHQMCPIPPSWAHRGITRPGPTVGGCSYRTLSGQWVVCMLLLHHNFNSQERHSRTCFLLVQRLTTFAITIVPSAWVPERLPTHHRLVACVINVPLLF